MFGIYSLVLMIGTPMRRVHGAEMTPSSHKELSSIISKFQAFEITVGSSLFNKKSVPIPQLGPAPGASLVCPAKVSVTNWLGNDKHPDWFSITVGSSNSITAQRGDIDEGWGMNLRFQCTYGWHSFSSISLDVSRITNTGPRRCRE